MKQQNLMKNDERENSSKILNTHEATQMENSVIDLREISKKVTRKYRLCELYSRMSILSYSQTSVYVLYGQQEGSKVYNHRDILSCDYEQALKALAYILYDDVIFDVIKESERKFFIDSNIKCFWDELYKNVVMYEIENLINPCTIDMENRYWDDGRTIARLTENTPQTEEPEEHKKARKKREKEMDNKTSDEVMLFIKQAKLTKNDLIDTRVGYLYKEYCRWSEESGFKNPVSQSKFTRVIKYSYGLETKQIRVNKEKRDRVFCRPKDEGGYSLEDIADSLDTFDTDYLNYNNTDYDYDEEYDYE